jgi:hypothetical protein
VPEEEEVAPILKKRKLTDNDSVAISKENCEDKGIQLTQVKVQVKMDVSLRAMSKTPSSRSKLPS